MEYFREFLFKNTLLTQKKICCTCELTRRIKSELLFSTQHPSDLFHTLLGEIQVCCIIWIGRGYASSLIACSEGKPIDFSLQVFFKVAVGRSNSSRGHFDTNFLERCRMRTYRMKLDCLFVHRSTNGINDQPLHSRRTQ